MYEAGDKLSENRLTPGQLLQQARTQQQLCRQDVSKKLYLSSWVINDLEDDIYRQTLDVSFMKGYLRTYARFLHIPEQKIMEAFVNLKLVEKAKQIKQTTLCHDASLAWFNKWLKKITVAIVFILGALIFLWWHGEYTEPTLSNDSPTLGQATMQQEEIGKPLYTDMIHKPRVEKNT
ncbi:MAG: helix-turn-helix domain-containing protein [Gammaproteobacteria bacterium]|nr:helix-turn-helix domain-containing protein [Gammaproteobacteria bacterium]